MGVNQPIFPSAVWDGAKGARSSRIIDAHSGIEDNDQIVAEIRAIQNYILNTLSSGGATYSAEADSLVDPGNVIYITSEGHLDLAQADNVASARAVGIVTVGANPTASATYVTEGKITLANWANITGTEFLTPGIYYFLDPDNAGQITSVAPTTIGEFVVVIGRATSNTELDIEINQPIRL